MQSLHLEAPATLRANREPHPADRADLPYSIENHLQSDLVRGASSWRTRRGSDGNARSQEWADSYDKQSDDVKARVVADLSGQNEKDGQQQETDVAPPHAAKEERRGTTRRHPPESH